DMLIAQQRQLRELEGKLEDARKQLDNVAQREAVARSHLEERIRTEGLQEAAAGAKRDALGVLLFVAGLIATTWGSLIS
ncbi:MAG: hypothetical protein ACRDLB_03165, partial [Actinomycetota bacterium]